MSLKEEVLSKYQIQTINEMSDWFEKRTSLHIGLVKKYIGKILELNLPEINAKLLEAEKEHDSSKFMEPEYTPYVHTTWKYKQKRLGGDYEIPEDMKAKTDEATFHHIKSNKHHPEYWDDKVKPNCLNSQDRDAPSGNMTDATKMPLTHIGAMMADWLAMSEEKNTNVNDWIKNNVNIRWKFSPKQVELIHKIAKNVTVDKLES